MLILPLLGIVLIVLCYIKAIRRDRNGIFTLIVTLYMSATLLWQ